jgi:hypothetical protein
MLKWYSLTIIIISSISSKLINNNESCIQLKSIFYKQITLFQDLKENDRNTLYDASLRGIMYDFMSNITFSEDSLNQQKLSLLGKINELRSQMKDTDVFNIKNQKEAQDLHIEWQNITSKELKNQEEMLKNDQLLHDLKLKLRELKNKLQSSQPQLEEKIQFLKQLNGFKASLDTENATSNTLLSILDQIQKVLIEFGMGLPDHLLSFREKLEDYLKVEDILETEEHVKSIFKLTLVTEVENDLKKLDTDKANLKYQLGNEQYYLQKELQAIIDKIQSEILNFPDYIEYQKNIEKGKDLISKSLGFVNIDKGFKKQLKRIQFQQESIKYRQVRLHHNEIIDFEREMKNLEQFMGLIAEESEISNQSRQLTNLEIFYQKNMTRLPQMKKLSETMTSEWEILQNLLLNENELDLLFGKVIGYLQGGISPEDSFRKCFISLELSVYMFYMSLFQVVISKNDFYLSMMNELPEESQTKLIKQLFKDLRSDPFQDSKMMNYYTGELVQGGLERSMDNYILLINSQMDSIFEKQISGLRDQKTGWYYSIMKYANFTRDLVYNVLKKGTLSIIFTAIATAILAVFSIVKIPLLLMVFVCGLLAVLSEMFFHWVGSKIKENPWIMQEWDRGVAKIIGMFSPNKISSLNVDEALDNDFSEDGIKVIADDEERYVYYKNKFLEIVSINNNYTKLANEHMRILI